MNLHEDQELFSELIRAAADYIGTRDVYVEKDYWVTYVHETDQGLHESGIMDKTTMREFDALCLRSPS